MSDLVRVQGEDSEKQLYVKREIALWLNFAIAVMSELKDRIKEAADQIGGLNKLSGEIGVPRRTVGGWVDGSTEPKTSAIAQIALATGVSIRWLVAGLAPKFEADAGQMQMQIQTMSSASSAASEFITVPRYDVQASAGVGAINVHEMPSGVIAFDRVFLRDLGAVPEQCFIVEAKGDSMQPTIPDGSLLVVDQSQREVDHGCIYVFRVGNRLLVKRARWRMDGKLELTSDNLLGGYPIEVFGAGDIDDIDVAGRVVYFSRVP